MLVKFDGESSPSQFPLHCNTGEGELLSNVSANFAMGLPEVRAIDPVKQEAVICGGGPSLADTLDSIRALRRAGAKVFALNNTAKYLVLNGIKPDVQIMVDPRPQNIGFLEKAWADEVYLCSQCDHSLFLRAKELDYPTKIWHPAIDGIEEIIGIDACRIGGGLTVGLASICIAHAQGHRLIHLFGYDSSHSEKKSHAYAQPMNADEEMVRAVVENRVFDCSFAMAAQAQEFKNVQDMLAEAGTVLKVYGDGLLPTLWRSWEREKNLKVVVACYDLGLSPPSYDFLSFLIEAERHRLDMGAHVIDIVFQPGPMHGFRADDLPPDVEARKGMLWRVCVGMARLLPSVRNINVLNTRCPVSGDVFPVEYAEDAPKSHYATAYLKRGKPYLRASESARRYVSKMEGYERYATITLRQSSYWPDRNSNLPAWKEVAHWLWSNGIWPIFVPDTEGECPTEWGYSREAALDVDVRAALYEGAVINLGVLNGPMSLCAFLMARYLIVKVVVETAIASSTSFLNAHGFKDGDSFGGNGKMVWKEDTAANIIAELQEFSLNQRKTL